MIHNRTVGVNFISGNEGAVKIWAPSASDVSLKFTGRDKIELHKTTAGFWEASGFDMKTTDRYQFLINGQTYPDPASLLQPDGVHNASCCFNLNEFQWTDQLWKGIRVENLIIYEIHTGTFSAEGTFDGILDKIEYLKELGINAVEIMPVAQFPGERNWGYDGVFPFAVQNSYGGPERLQNLVNNLHRNGIAVILDVVYNHLGPEGNYMPVFGPVFTDKYKTPWGKAINFDDEWCDGVRLFFIENALMWLRDFHIDGLRLDAVHAIKDFSTLHILADLKKHVSSLNSSLSANHFLISESDLNDVKLITSSEKGGYELDATWCDEFHHSLHALVTGENKGYYSDFGSVHHLVKSLNNAFVYDGIWSGYRKRLFGTKTDGFPGHKFVVFTQNHDQVGNRMRGERLSALITFEQLKVQLQQYFLARLSPCCSWAKNMPKPVPFCILQITVIKSLLNW